ncbi:hypothetical protein CLU79DRAFT_704947 [Phycomyces nitens]|nr:hypothetical protein CLU79DRAFT_704947 [Phycomyces nitens]
MPVVCNYCHSEGHKKTQCPKKNNKSSHLCYSCKQPGHIRTQCPDETETREHKRQHQEDLPVNNVYKTQQENSIVDVDAIAMRDTNQALQAEIVHMAKVQLELQTTISQKETWINELVAK